MTFPTLVPPQCTTGMKYAFGVSIIRLRGITADPGIHRRHRPGQGESTVSGPPPAGSCERTPRHLRWRIIATVQLIAHRNTPGAFGEPRGARTETAN